MTSLDSPLDQLQPVFLDTETTGRPKEGDKVAHEPLSVSLVNYDGTVLFHARVRPVRHTSWPEAQAVHGIAPADVLRDDVPTFAELAPQLADLIRGRLLVAYNLGFDCAMVAEALVLGPPAQMQCAMEQFAEYYGDWSDYHQSYTWVPLASAAKHVLHAWRGAAHDSLSDAFALRDVWEFVHWLAKREAVAEERERRAEVAEEKRHIKTFLTAQQWREDARYQQLNDAWVAANHFRLGLVPAGAPAAAAASADAFSQHLLGYPVTVWNAYGAHLKRRRYGPGCKWKLPDYLVRSDSSKYAFLRRPWQPANCPQLAHLPGPVIEPAAMYVQPGFSQLTLVPLLDLRKLTLGVDYVPIAPYEWPEGHASATTLNKVHKLKPKQIALLRPTFMRYGKDYAGNLTQYLLYAIPAPVLAVA